MVFVIIHDTIQALGLKYIFKNYFNISITHVHPSLMHTIIDNESSIYITTPHLLHENNDFFQSKKNQTVIITQAPTTDPMSINLHHEECDIIQQISSILESIGTTSQKPSDRLSQREIEVLKLIAMGYINKEIAHKLSISFNTVLTHRKNISSKLGIKSVSGLGIYAVMNGYISEPNLKR
ncbi:MAG: response regulator transcription factor [Bacteroidales bacterium]|nr:response regulator transcription factor [Bacteroidales bacterium]